MGTLISQGCVCVCVCGGGGGHRLNLKGHPTFQLIFLINSRCRKRGWEICMRHSANVGGMDGGPDFMSNYYSN